MKKYFLTDNNLLTKLLFYFTLKNHIKNMIQVLVIYWKEKLFEAKN